MNTTPTQQRQPPQAAPNTRQRNTAPVDPAKALEIENEKQLPVLVEKMAAAVDMLPVQFYNTVKITCGLEKANYAQVLSFLLTARKYGLDPMVRQIYAFESHGKVVPIVPIDGWLKIINENPQFDGMEFEDIFDGADIFSVTCKIYRKDRRVPIVLTEYLSECKQATGPWKWKIRMLRHKALIQCARYAFGLSGIFDEDEAQRIHSASTPDEVKRDVDQHMHDIGADPHDAEYVEEEVSRDRQGIEESREAAEPSDWDAVYDELSPGVDAAKTPLELKMFLEENADRINSMGQYAPNLIVEKWVKLVTTRQDSFPKK